jgi:hypothetical protein
MGKRELVLIVAFVALGTVVYELSAPAKTTSRGFSLSRLFNSARDGLRANMSSASTTMTGTLTVSAALEELSVSSVTRGVRITGEERNDISYELTVESTGPDEATALSYAKHVALKSDDLGQSLSLRAEYPTEATQQAALVLHVPSRLAIRIDGGGRADIAGVRAVELQGVSGPARLEHIAGDVTGTQSGGDVQVMDAGSVRLTLLNSRAEFTDVKSGLTIDARSGACTVTGCKGPLECEETNVDVEVHDHDGTIHISGNRGGVTIEHPRQSVKVDVLRAEVMVTAQAAVPMALITSQETLKLVLDGSPAVAIDAVATSGGAIHADDFGLTPDKGAASDEVHLAHAFGSGTLPRISLRNTRGDIVIAQRK